jgi:hypothetical protein
MREVGSSGAIKVRDFEEATVVVELILTRDRA